VSVFAPPVLNAVSVVDVATASALPAAPPPAASLPATDDGDDDGSSGVEEIASRSVMPVEDTGNTYAPNLPRKVSYKKGPRLFKKRAPKKKSLPRHRTEPFVTYLPGKQSAGRSRGSPWRPHPPDRIVGPAAHAAAAAQGSRHARLVTGGKYQQQQKQQQQQYPLLQQLQRKQKERRSPAGIEINASGHPMHGPRPVFAVSGGRVQASSAMHGVAPWSQSPQPFAEDMSLSGSNLTLMTRKHEVGWNRMTAKQ